MGMDMGTWGWIWGHWNVYRAIGMAMGPSGRLWDVGGRGGRGAIGMAVDSPGRPRGPQPDGRTDRWTDGQPDGQMDSRTDSRPDGRTAAGRPYRRMRPVTMPSHCAAPMGS